VSSNDSRFWKGISLIGFFVGVVSLLYAFHTTQESKQTRDPSFVVDPSRATIFDPKQIAGAPIRVLRRDGTPLQSDLVAVRFYFWNAGKLPIHRSEVLLPIEIHLKGASILDAKILKRTRQVTGLRLLPAPSGPSTSLLLDFSILEQGDGAACQVLYEGRPDAIISVSGAIEGAKDIRTAASTPTDRLAALGARVKLGTFGALVMCALLSLILLVVSGISYVVDRWVLKAREKADATLRQFIGNVWSVSGLRRALGVFVLLFGMVFLLSYNQPAPTLNDLVPSELRRAQ
jgi:hypothetical protein